MQWARLAREYARVRLGVDEPTIALLSNGEEAGKGDALRKEAFELLSGVKGFIGNVEGRDLSRVAADVIVTDGFTGNVALKTLEGAMSAIAGPRVLGARRARVRRRRADRSSCGCSRRPPICCPTRPAARCCSASTACA